MSIPFTSNLWQGRLLTSPDDVKASASSLTLTAGSNTDWWRATHGSVPESDVDRHSGPLYVVEVADDQQTWTAGVWMAVEHGERFQQATLFVGQGDFVTARDPWLKAGVEIEEKRQNIGSVVAAPISDWALFPAPRPVTKREGSWLYVEAKRTGADVILSYAHGSPNPSSGRPADTEKHLMREVKGFAKAIGRSWQVGVMTCGPKSQKTESTFHYFTFTKDDA